MTEAAPAPPPSRPTAPELLAQALEHLSPEERQQVTAWFLTRSTISNLSPRRGSQEVLHALVPGPEAFRDTYGQRVGRDQQVVPVRLPADLHRRLRLWCNEHGFSMATVVRGLVSRFLDSQATGVEAPDQPPSTS
jgi:hypothetical protein